MKKKLSVLYLVLMCSILAISTIGSTYAYWVASTQSANNEVTAESRTYNISLDISPLYTDITLIPMNDSDALKGLKNSCYDKYHRGACNAYKIRVHDFDENLEYISGTINFKTEHMENISYTVLEETEENDLEKCTMIEEKNYCLGIETTHMEKETDQSIGNSYSVRGKNEKTLILVIWLTNLNENQNESDIGSYTAEVTISAGNGGQIKGTIAGVVQSDMQSEITP